jgi:hypothetical protein
MPHDRNGTKIEAGDVVNIPCIVRSVSSDGDFCNMTVDTIEVMPGNKTKNTITLNCKQCDKWVPLAVAAPKVSLSPESRAELRDALLSIGGVLSIFAKRTPFKWDDKLAKAMMAAGMGNDDVLDKIIDVFDTSV